MATRDYLKHFVSNTQPTNATIGDEWYNPVTNLFYKNVALNGTTPTFNPISSSLVIQNSGTTLNSNTSNINFVGFTMSVDATGKVIINPPSAAASGADTYVQFNNSGALGGSANFTWNNTTQTLALTGFLTTFALSRSGGINSTSWSTTSPMFNSAAALLTDTTGTGTIALRAGHTFNSVNFASSSATVLTDAANVYINSPVANTNTTITNNWSLYVAGNQRVTGTLYVDGNAQLAGSRIIDYKNTTAQWTMSGGGLVTWTGTSLLWGTRVIVIPVANPTMGSAGYFDITCPTSGTVTYYQVGTGTSTVTATAAGIPLGSWEALYYLVTEGMASASDQTKFAVVNYQNTTWRPSTGWLLLAAVNGEGANIGHVKWLPGQINLPSNGSTVTYNVGTGAVTGFNAGGALQSLTMNNGGAGAASGTTFNGGTAQTISYNTIGAAASNQTMYIGTTAVAINRTSANLALTGITSIDGSANSATTFTSTTQNSQFASIGINVAPNVRGPFDLNKVGFAASGNWYELGRFVDASANKGISLGYDNASQLGLIVGHTNSAASGTAFWSWNGTAWGERMRIETISQAAPNLLVGQTTYTNTGVSGSTTVASPTFVVGGQAAESMYIRRFGTGIYQQQTNVSGSNAGSLQLQPYAGSVIVGGNGGTTTNKFEVQGTTGQLFSVTDSMTGTIFSANDVSGIPSIEILDTGLVKLAQYGGFVAYGISTAQTATGSTQATALAITRPITDVTTVAASTGVILPTPVIGMRILIRNSGANSLNVYPNSGGQINSLGTNVAFTHFTGSLLEFISFSSTQWYTMNATFAA